MKFIVPFIFALALAGCESDLISKKDQMTALTAIENGALLVDVRSAKEVSTGSFDNAINIPHTDIVADLEKLGVDKIKPLSFIAALAIGQNKPRLRWRQRATPW